LFPAEVTTEVDEVVAEPDVVLVVVFVVVVMDVVMGSQVRSPVREYA